MPPACFARLVNDRWKSIMEPSSSEYLRGEVEQDFVSCDTTPVYQDPAEQVATFFDVSFTCPIRGCHVVFTNSRTYRNHRVRTHGLPRYNCIVCLVSFDAYQNLLDHMVQENHHVSCTVCNFKFRSPGAAQAHYNLKHRPYTCCHCSVNIEGKADLKTHLELHNQQEGSPFNATSFLEVAINSYSESSYDLPNEIQLVEDLNAEGSAYLPIVLDDDDSNEPPDSTSQTLPVSGVLVRSADSSSMDCSDSNTAATVSQSDADPPTYPFSLQTADNAISSEAVVFGPGASDLFNGNSTDDCTQTADSPELPAVPNQEDGAMDWIGHNVDMYQLMSQKHKKTYRYNCSKCSCTFSNKDILKRHLNIHDFVCKHCFLRFNSLVELKSHLQEQHAKPQTFQCLMCGHSLHGLKSLMVHEMLHRLNSAFKREAEDSVQLDNCHRTQFEYFECKICEELVKGFSKFVRHKVWHSWDSMWNSYVTGRIFKGTFTEDEANKFSQEVEEKLTTKWRDCCEKKVDLPKFSGSVGQTAAFHETDTSHEADTSNEAEAIAVQAIETETENKMSDESPSKSNDNSEEDTDTASETDESTSEYVNKWMDYWNSYLGLDESPPSWVRPILKNIRSQWKLFSGIESGTLYKQMDQIGMLIRAQKNNNPREGPTVILERLPSSLLDTTVNHNSPVENLKQNVANNMTNNTSPSAGKVQKQAPSRTKKGAGPASVTRVHRSASTELSDKTNKAIDSFLKGLISEETQNCSEAAEEFSASEKTESLNMKPSQDATREKSNVGKGTSPRQPLTDEASRLGLKRPVVLLSRLDWLEPEHEVKKTRNPAVPCLPNNSEFSDMVARIQREAGSQDIPKWATLLINSVCQNPQQQTEKMLKINQIINLIKLQRGDSLGTVEMPVVKINRYK